MSTSNNTGSKKRGKPGPKPGRRKAAKGSKLTLKREKFVREIVRQELTGEGSRTTAAIKAGYSPASARIEASRLLTFANIRAAIENRKKILREHADLEDFEITGVLAMHLRGDMTEVLDEHGQLDLDRVRELGMGALIKKLKTETRFEKTLVPDPDGSGEVVVEMARVVVTDFELYSSQEAAKTLGKFNGLEQKKGSNQMEERKRKLRVAIEQYKKQKLEQEGVIVTDFDAMRALAPWIPEWRCLLTDDLSEAEAARLLP